MNKNNVKRIKLRILIIALTSTMALGAILASIAYLFNKKEKNDIKSIITQEADNTYFDDFMVEELEKDLICLEEYIKLSNELNKILGKEYTIEEKYLEDGVLKSPEEISKIISKYDETKKDIDVLKELKIQTGLVNKYLKTDGYDILANALLYAFKIEFIDAYGLDKEISKKILEEIVVPSYEQMNFGDLEDRKDSIIIGKNPVYYNYRLENVLSKIYTLQDNAGKQNTNGYNYNKDRNKLLEDSFDMLKDLIEEQSKIKIK